MNSSGSSAPALSPFDPAVTAHGHPVAHGRQADAPPPCPGGTVGCAGHAACRRAGARDPPGSACGRGGGAQLVRAAYEHYVPRIGRPPVPMTLDYAGIVAARPHLAGGAGRAAPRGARAGAASSTTSSSRTWPSGRTAQGTGAGSRLLRHAEDEARSRGVREVRLYTHELMTENRTVLPAAGDTGRRICPETRPGVGAFFAKAAPRLSPLGPVMSVRQRARRQPPPARSARPASSSRPSPAASVGRSSPATRASECDAGGAAERQGVQHAQVEQASARPSTSAEGQSAGAAPNGSTSSASSSALVTHTHPSRRSR